MFKMIIESDHEKLLREGKYDVKAFDALIRKMCVETNFRETSVNHYALDDEYDELGEMLVLDAKFDKHGDIIPNLKTWITFSEYEGEVDQLTGED